MKMWNRNLALIASAILMMLPLITLAQIEEVIVTAQKRAESLQDVPISIQAFSGDQINELGVQKASDIVKLAPNINLSGQNVANNAINIRGIGTSDFFGAAPGSVGIYMDEVTMSSPYLTSVGLFDMERVEVLRGPQNSLFGRNTTGGAVNFISRLPEVGGERDGFLRFTYGRFNRIEAEAAGTFQLGDTAAIRIAGKSFHRDGIWDDVSNNGAEYGDKDRKSVRGTIVWEPQEVTKVTANFHYGDEDSEVDPARVVGTRLDPSGVFVGPSLSGEEVDFDGTDYATFTGQGVDPSDPDWENVRMSGANKHDMEAWGAYLKIEHDFDWGVATSITAYDESDTKFTIDLSGGGNFDPTPASIAAGFNTPEDNVLVDQDQHFEQFSQEIRIQSPGDQRLRWIAGFYYFSEDSELAQRIGFGAANIIGSPIPTSPNFSGLPYPQLTGGSLALWSVTQRLGEGFQGAGFSNLTSFSIATMDNEVLSPYGRLEFDVTDSLTFTLGLRYTDDTKEIPSYFVGLLDNTNIPITQFYSNEFLRSTAAAQLAAGTASPVCTGGPPPAIGARICAQDTTRGDLHAKEWGGKAGLDWRFHENHMIFASYSRGFRSGRFDVEFLHGPQTGFPLADSDPETLDAYEIGIKSNFADNTLQMNLSAFFYEWFDKQTFFVDPAKGPAFSNVPKSESKGIELEVKWAPTDTIFITAGLGLLDTEIKEGSGLGSDQVGHELQQAPGSSFNILASKEFNLGDGILNFQIDYAYREKSKNGLAPADLTDELDKQSLLGARATYIFGSQQQYEISAFGENITANKFCTFHFNLAAINGAVSCNPNEGQAMWGLQGAWRF
jgi:iron complex outermembrane receptor protein